MYDVYHNPIYLLPISKNYVLYDLMYLFSKFIPHFFVQYISLLFIGMLVVISVRGFLTNLMKVFLLLSIANFFPLGVTWISYIVCFTVKQPLGECS